jgi:hypothetical protein
MALHNRELLEAKTTELLLTRHADVTDKTGYAYGIWIDDDWGRMRVHHAEGGDDGVNFVSGAGFGDDVIATVISNSDEGVGKIYRSILDQVLQP